MGSNMFRFFEIVNQEDEELEESVKRQFKLLNADGVICHSFWRGEGFEIFKGLFVNYHTEVGLKKVFENKYTSKYIYPCECKGKTKCKL